MPDEIWKPIAGYEGSYEVSNFGRVRSLDRMLLGRDGREELHHGRLLKLQTLWNGYLQVDLALPGQKRKHRPVHQLVAEAFLGPRPKKHDVMHIDGNRTNNRAENLCYGTRAHNLHQTYEYGKMKKLTREDVLRVFARIENGESNSEIAKSFGVSPSAIYRIRVGKNFAWLRKELEENAAYPTRAALSVEV